MLVEIPDMDVILSWVVAFLVGVIGLSLYYKLKPRLSIGRKGDEGASLERLEYYEKQLIDMKIRLDALDMVSEPEPAGSTGNTAQAPAKNTARPEFEAEAARPERRRRESTPSYDHANITDYVLRLITDKPMTSRDIQVTVGRTREHISRLMKKLFEDGLVERNTAAKPYTYSITEKGRTGLGIIKPVPVAV